LEEVKESDTRDDNRWVVLSAVAFLAIVLFATPVVLAGVYGFWVGLTAVMVSAFVTVAGSALYAFFFLRK
jgi:hypothetical protein